MEITIRTTDATEARAMLAALEGIAPPAIQDPPAHVQPPPPVVQPQSEITAPPTQPAPQNYAPPVVTVPTYPPQTPPPVMQGLPTTAPTYTLDMLARAAVSLHEGGKDVSQALFPKYGIQMLNQLPPARFAEFALDLRGMGAQI